MKEEINPNVFKDWEKKLEEAGLPDDMGPLQVPLPSVSARETLLALDPEMEPSLEKFSTLSGNIQDDILADLKKQRDLKTPPRKILDRFEVLILKGQELESMTSADSDKTHQPQPSKDELEKKEIEDAADRTVTNLIKKIEKIRRRDNVKPNDVDYYKH